MWSALSASRWICLLTLAVVMLSSTSQADSTIISLPCCYTANTTMLRKVTECYEQTPRGGCNNHAFLVRNKRIRAFRCISPDAQWLKDRIKTGKVTCRRVTEEV